MADWLNNLFSHNLFGFVTDQLNKFGQSYASSARAAEQEARDYTAQREDTAVQRRVEDIKAAGLNPYLALTNGSLQSADSSSANSASSAAQGVLEGAGLSVNLIKTLTSAYKAIADSAYKGASLGAKISNM